MKEGRDLALTLVTCSLLLLGLTYLTQCGTQRPVSTVEGQRSTAATRGNETERDATVGTRKSEDAETEGEEPEEREKIQRVGRALQTIGANPEGAVTHPFCRFRMVGRNGGSLLDQEEVVSKSVSFYERDHPAPSRSSPFSDGGST